MRVDGTRRTRRKCGGRPDVGSGRIGVVQDCAPGRATKPTVHLLCGLPGSGKTTLARQLAADGMAVRFTLGEWMLRVHDLRYDHPDYGSAVADCRELIWDTAKQVLATGADVVLDWSQWSRAKRVEWAQRAQGCGAGVLLHVIDVDANIATAQAASRRDPFSHQIDAEGVAQMVDLLEPPDPDEGIEVVIHSSR